MSCILKQKEVITQEALDYFSLITIQFNMSHKKPRIVFSEFKSLIAFLKVRLNCGNIQSFPKTDHFLDFKSVHGVLLTWVCFSDVPNMLLSRFLFMLT